PIIGGKAAPPLFARSAVTSALIDSAVPPEYRLRHDGRVASRVAVPFMAEAVRRVIEPSGLTPADYFLVSHQPAVPVVHALGASLGLPPDQYAISSDDRGNMSTASVPVT